MFATAKHQAPCIQFRDLKNARRFSKSSQRCSHFPTAVGMQVLGRQRVSPWEEPVARIGNPQAHRWSRAWGHQDKEGLNGHPKQSPTILFNARRAFLILAALIQRAALSQICSLMPLVYPQVPKPGSPCLPCLLHACSLGVLCHCPLIRRIFLPNVAIQDVN